MAIVAMVISSYAQQKLPPPGDDFKTNYVNTSEMIIEGTIVDISYFRDSDSVVFNTNYPCFTYDEKGIWFIKYTILPHKLFKGVPAQQTITVIDLNHSGVIEDKGMIIRVKRNCKDGYDRGDYAVNRTGIFFLKRNFYNCKPGTGGTYYLNEVVGDYNKIVSKYVPSLLDNGKVIEFNDTKQLYKYVEEKTGNKTVDISNKKFRILTNATLNQYLVDHFHDSAFSKSIQDKVLKGEINQLNIEQYQVKATVPDKELQRKEQIRKDSIYNMNQKEGMKFIEEQREKAKERKKEKSFNKSGEAVTYSFVNATYTKAAGVTYLEFDVNFNSNASKYLYQTNVEIKYSTTVFGSNVIANSALTVTRGALVSDPAKYPNFSQIQMASNAVLLTAFGAQSTSPPVSNNNVFFSANTDYIVFHVKLKVASGGLGGSTNLSFDAADMSSIFPGSFTETATGSSATSFSIINATATENHLAGRAEINSFNSYSIAGGVGNTFEINGRFFGSSQGISGDVQLQCSESKKVGANLINIGTFVSLDPGFDIITWTDRKITIKLPSKVNWFYFPVTIGSGDVKVTNDLYPVATTSSSANPLDVPYSLYENFEYTTGNVLYSKTRYVVGNQDGNNSYSVKVHQDVVNNTGAMKCIISALKKWSCETNMNWKIAEIVNYFPTGSHAQEPIIYFDDLGSIAGSGGTLMATTPVTGSCIGGTAPMKLFNIAINNNSSVVWNYNMTSSTISSGQDFYQAMLHELGHGIGLAHTEHASSYDLMYYTVSHPGSRVLAVNGNDKSGGAKMVNYSSTINPPACGMDLLYPPNCNTTAASFSVSEIYLSHNCASSTLHPEIRTRFPNTATVSPPEYTYIWEAQSPDMEGAYNASTLNSYAAVKPVVKSYTLTGTTAVVSYKLTVYDDSDIPNRAVKAFTTYLRSGIADDYSMRDSYLDRLNEPNDQAARSSGVYWDIWQSPDIWNRVRNDGLTEHEDPQYKGATTNNYLYTRIRNVGCSIPAAGSTRNLRLYWTVNSTGEKWDEDWTTTNITTPSGSFPGGREITTGSGIRIGTTLRPGDEKVIVQPWIPPRPQNYNSSFKTLSACVLARIEESSSYPFGMTIGEFFQTPPKSPLSAKSIKDNVTNNNNIITRNLYVNNLDDLKKTGPGNPVLVGGTTPGNPISIRIGVEPGSGCEDLPGFFEIGTVRMVLPQMMFEAWMAEGSPGYGITYDADTYTINMEEEDAQIDMLNPVNIYEENRSFIQLFFALRDPLVYSDINCYYNFGMRQINTPGDDEYGASNFRVNVNLQPADPELISSTQTITGITAADHSQIVLFPSPTTGNLNISYTETVGANTIKIYNQLGMLVKEFDFNPANKQDIIRALDISGLSNGCYFVTISNANGIVRKRFLKE